MNSDTLILLLGLGVVAYLIFKPGTAATPVIQSPIVPLTLQQMLNTPMPSPSIQAPNCAYGGNPTGGYMTQLDSRIPTLTCVPKPNFAAGNSGGYLN